MDDANRPLLLLWRKFTVVEPHLRGLEGVYVHPNHRILLRSVMQHEIGPLDLSDEVLRYLPALRRVLLVQEIFNSIEIALTPRTFAGIIHLYPEL